MSKDPHGVFPVIPDLIASYTFVIKYDLINEVGNMA